jgi:hypothetical protein
MALQMETYLSGRMNNVVFFKRAGTYMARSLPAAVKLSAATKVCNGNFGIASACGKSLRQLLLPVLPFPKDRRMQIRFSGAIAKWLGAANAASLPPVTAIPFVNQFRFTDCPGISERWKLGLLVEQPAANTITLHIPAFIPTQTISAPEHTVAVTCTITVAGSMLMGAAPTGSHSTTMEIAYTDTVIPAQTMQWPLPAPAGTVILVAVALRYRLAGGGYCSAPAFLPASVIDARYC